MGIERVCFPKLLAGWKVANPTHEGPACREDYLTSRAPTVGNILFSFSTVVRIISYTVDNRSEVFFFIEHLLCSIPYEILHVRLQKWLHMEAPVLRDPTPSSGLLGNQPCIGYTHMYVGITPYS